MGKQEGDRKICQVCQKQGINSEIHVEKVSDKFGERLSWKNSDGSSHFAAEEENGLVTFIHVPTIKTENDVRFMELEDRISRIERQVGIMWSGE